MIYNTKVIVGEIHIISIGNTRIDYKRITLPITADNKEQALQLLINHLDLEYKIYDIISINSIQNESTQESIITVEKACKRLEYAMKASSYAISKFNDEYSKLPKSIKRQIRKRKWRVKIDTVIFKFKTWIKYKLIKLKNNDNRRPIR